MKRSELDVGVLSLFPHWTHSSNIFTSQSFTLLVNVIVSLFEGEGIRGKMMCEIVDVANIITCHSGAEQKMGCMKSNKLFH